MNIGEAKSYIKDTVVMYLKKDEYGDYRIPMQRQRPIFLQGVPGIGKSAIMEQIASEIGIALVSYSMTHHTRQSALGLPYIKTKEYGGRTVDVSEYTMSEIIASIYETMEESGITEGILFLDEINCVSETLYPSMLQFLQFKTFGRHKVPDGWVIVTAGNPPQYNKSVREFDVVTLDRLKVMEVDEDYDAWRRYASEQNVHAAVLSFLDNNREFFYKIEKTVEGCTYVTARGWQDLSDMLYLYEEESLPVSESFISQYIADTEIAREFSIYYDLYRKYRNDYKADVILANSETDGKIIDKMAARAKMAAADERLSLAAMLLDNVKSEISDIIEEASVLREVNAAFKSMLKLDSREVLKFVDSMLDAQDKIIKKQESAGTLTVLERHHRKNVIALYESLKERLNEQTTSTCGDDVVTDNKAMCTSFYNNRMSILKNRVRIAGQHLCSMFEFVKKAFGDDSNEMLIIVTEMTVNSSFAEFIAAFGCDEYLKYKDSLKITDRREEIKKWIMEELN